MAKADTPFGQMPDHLAMAGNRFPILKHLGAALRQGGALKDVVVGWHCHLTWLTALALEPYLSAGAQMLLCECDRATSDSEAIASMRAAGATVYEGADSLASVIAHRPSLISDTGLVLFSLYLESPYDGLYGACEITTSGIRRLRTHDHVPLPVVNINDGQLKSRIENFHGVGDGVIDALYRLTGSMWAGRAVAVAGYGQVGAGVARYLARSGAVVRVVEVEAVRRLTAHYDGFALTSLHEALAQCDLLITATGLRGLLGEKQWEQARDGLIVLNVGHWADEVDREALVKIASQARPIGKYMEEFLVGAKDAPRKIYLATGGSPANVVLLSGSLEPTLIHLTTEALTLNYLSQMRAVGFALPPGENPLPLEVERLAATLALDALGLSGDTSNACRLESQDRTC